MGYSKQETIKKQKSLVSKSHRNKRKVLISIFKYFLVAIVAIIIGCAGAGFGMLKGILDNVPDIDKISIQPKGFKTIIYDQSGTEINSISTINSNRIYVYYDEIPKNMVDGFVAIEDSRFWEHNGIDVKGIVRAAVNGVSTGEFDEGASTITQQLIKNQVFNVGLDEDTFMDKVERKVQEQYLALELEKRYTKEEIVEYYLNTIYLGQGVHGIQSAANLYFNKDISDLTISEIAVLAGITQNPYQYDPIIFPEGNADRRLMVLKKMKEQGYIDQAEYETAINDDVYGRIAEVQELEKAENKEVNSYYTDALINSIVDDFEELYGCTEEEAFGLLYTGGYSVYSVQDEAIQDICDEVVNDPSFYGSDTTVSLSYELTIKGDNDEINNYSLEELVTYYKELTGDSSYKFIYPNEESARAASDGFKEAMLEETKGTFIAEKFDVKPQPQFAFTILDQQTGYIKAIVGGRGEKKSNLSFNRATEAKRQPGSTFKIVFAYLPLIDTGLGSLAKPYLDEPFKYVNGVSVNNWWGWQYRGYVTVRDGIRDSMNVIAAKAVTDVTPDVAYEYSQKLGLNSLVAQRIDSEGNVYSDIQQATALGGLTDGVTNLEITGAYAVIANGGEYIKPVFYSKILDHDGNVVIDHTTPTRTRVIKETTAWQLIDAMKTVVNSGTGTAARMQTGITCAGKTGTTSNAYDLYFCGMTPYYTASIWMGFDSPTDMSGYNGSLHKTIWRTIMDRIAEYEGQDPTLDWIRPDGITSVTLCKVTGQLPGPDCPTCTDYCAVDAIPSIRCKGHEIIEICEESHLKATENCPNKKKYVVVYDELTKKKKIVGYDQPYDDSIFDSTCPIHPVIKEEDKFTISSSAGVGGSISSSVQANKGSTVTFYIAPNTGYIIKDVLVDGVSVGAVDNYTFNDLNGNHTITATFESVGGTTQEPTTQAPSTQAPTTEATTQAPTTQAPTTEATTVAPTTVVP